MRGGCGWWSGIQRSRIVVIIHGAIYLVLDMCDVVRDLWETFLIAVENELVCDNNLKLIILCFLLFQKVLYIFNAKNECTIRIPTVQNKNNLKKW